MSGQSQVLKDMRQSHNDDIAASGGRSIKSSSNFSVGNRDEKETPIVDSDHKMIEDSFSNSA